MSKTTIQRSVQARPAAPRITIVGDGAALRVYKKYLPQIQKRDGRIVPFELQKIVGAIERAMKASNEGSPDEAVVVAHKVAGEMMRIAKTYKNFLPTVEGCQDEVERQLMLSDYVATAKNYILYRQERSEIRKEQGEVPERVRKLSEESKKYFKHNPLGEFVYLRTYARWIESEQRRETWIETVDRYVNFMRENLGDKLGKREYAELREAILNQEVMPSMRAMQFSGEPARKCNTCFYNCSFIAPRKLEDFAEIMYLSMQGCGVGYAVESYNVQQLPQIEKQTGEKLPKHVVADTKEGWCDALTLGLKAWYGGKDVDFEYSHIRPAGSRLKTMGGKASGPEPLRSLLSFARERILKRQGRRLRNIDAHDIICKIGECVVAGGVRRCMPAGTRVHTKRGSVPIEEVRVGDKVMTSSGYKPVTAWVAQGVQRLVELKTESGTLFKCTPDHRIAVLSDVWGGYVFKQAQHITQDDRLLFITHAIDGEKTMLLDLPEKRLADHSGSRVSQPALTSETAWFMGKFFADGYVQVTPHAENGKEGNTTFSLAFHEKETVQIARARHWFASHGLRVADHAGEEERCVKLRSNNRQIARWMYQYKQPNMPLHIPEEVWRASQDVRAAFIAGVMDGDGTYSDRPVTVASTVYESFAREMVKLLATLGIISEIRVRRPATLDGWQALWVVSIKDAHALERARKLVGARACGAWIARKGKQAGYTVPGEFVKRDVPRALWATKWPAARDPDMNSATLTKLVHATHYVPVKVVDIRDGGESETYDIEVKDGSTFVAEGYLVHNTAMISLSDLDDVEIRDAKKGQFFLTDPYRSVANNSAVYESKPTNAELMDEWVALMKSGTGERGIFNRGSLEKTLPKRRLEHLRKKYGKGNGYIGQIGTNPCVTGDTLVYVADGRGNVPIKQLAEEGKDVPVFCLDERGGLAVRTMRNPRITGRNAEIYEVTLDDGSTIRTTANHKFRLKSGEYKEVGDLRYGDSVHILTRFEASIKDLFPEANARSQDYWWVHNGRMQNIGEHRLIAAFHHNAVIPRGYVVHHKDRDARNNAPDNLEIISKEAHDMLHGVLMRGDNNPMRRAAAEWGQEKWDAYWRKHSENNSGENNANFSGVTDAMLRAHSVRLTEHLGRRFSNRDWSTYAKQHRLPQYFSKWRRDHLGGILGLAKWAALECGIEHIEADTRVVDSYRRYTRIGYDCAIVAGALVIRKSCEVCDRAFHTTISRRESGICGMSCAQKRSWAHPTHREARIANIHAAHTESRAQLRERQAKVYSDLKFALGRTPLKAEWRSACTIAGVSPEISRESAPFRSFAALREQAALYNHKIVSVKRCGTADVYNGTVDEFHNFFVGGFISSTRAGKAKMVYLNNVQCGEILLQSHEFCNLSEVIARPHDTEATLVRKTKLATLLGTYQSTLTNFRYISEDWKKNCESERLLGVSITGQWDSPAVRSATTLRKMRQIAIKTNQQYAKRFGINPSMSITCVKPSGTVSQAFDCSSGIHPRHAHYYIRRIRISATDSLFKMIRDQGVPHHPEVGQTAGEANTYVLEFPVKAPSGSIFKDDLTALQQLEYWKLVKLNFTEHNPSATISVGEEEWVQVVAWLYENWDIIGGLSFLPRSNHVYRLAPYEAIDKKTYEQRMAQFPTIDYSKLVIYERSDETEQAKELACAGGTCEIV